MTVLGLGALAALGLAVGLFLDLVIDRVPARQPLLARTFRCGRCPDDVAGERLALATLARPGSACPACGQALGPAYWLVPLGTALLFVLLGLRLGADWALPAYLVFAASMVAVTVIDLRLEIIPNRVVYPTIFLSLPLLLLAAVAEGDPGRFLQAVLGATVAWVGFLAIHLVSPRGMGFGDVRLSFILGLFLAWIELGLVLTGLFLGFLLGAVVGVVLVVAGRRDRKSSVPFGPFLAAGALLAVLAGPELNRFWLGP